MELIIIWGLSPSPSSEHAPISRELEILVLLKLPLQPSLLPCSVVSAFAGQGWRRVLGPDSLLLGAG